MNADQDKPSPCLDPLCEDGEYKDDSMLILGVPGGRVGYALCSTCNGTGFDPSSVEEES